MKKVSTIEISDISAPAYSVLSVLFSNMTQKSILLLENLHQLDNFNTGFGFLLSF